MENKAKDSDVNQKKYSGSNKSKTTKKTKKKEPKKDVYEIVNGFYDNENGKIILEDSAITQEFHEKQYFGTLLANKLLELEVVEALLLLERNRINIFKDRNSIKNEKNKEKMRADDILSSYVKIDPEIWVKFLVYRDLRQRGYIVRMGFGDSIDFRVFPRGSTKNENIAKFFIFILNEENPVHLQKLSKITKQTINARKDLILAIVDRLGEPTYYQLEQFKLKINTNKKKLW